MAGTASRTRTARPTCKHSTTEPQMQLAVMLIFRLLTYIGNDKLQKKNKTNTDPNPTIDDAGKRKGTE